MSEFEKYYQQAVKELGYEAIINAPFTRWGRFDDQVHVKFEIMLNIMDYALTLMVKNYGF